MELPNQRECLPIFLEGDGAKRPHFDANIHHEKLAFYQKSLYEEEHTSNSARFWTHEQAVYYSRTLLNSNRIFHHEYLDIPLMKNLDCFNQVLQDIEDYQLAKVFTFKHPWNHECILQFYATLYVSGDNSDIKTWIMEWMTENHQVKCSVMEFLDFLHFPRYEA